MIDHDTGLPPQGILAKQAGRCFPLKICKSHRGFYIGTLNEGMPYTRESQEYWGKEEQATAALQKGAWTQKQNL